MDKNGILMKADKALEKYGPRIREGGRVQVAAGQSSIITRWVDDLGETVNHDKIPDWIDGVVLYDYRSDWYLDLENYSSHDAQQARDSRKWAPDQIGIINVAGHAGIETYSMAENVKFGDPGRYELIHGTPPWPQMVACILPYSGLASFQMVIKPQNSPPGTRNLMEQIGRAHV